MSQINNPVPDFAIAQNDKTFQSAIWSKDEGEWVCFPSKDYDKLKLIAEMIRISHSVPRL